jgi:hypothetical protein
LSFNNLPFLAKNDFQKWPKTDRATAKMGVTWPFFIGFQQTWALK